MGRRAEVWRELELEVEREGGMHTTRLKIRGGGKCEFFRNEKSAHNRNWHLARSGKAGG